MRKLQEQKMFFRPSQTTPKFSNAYRGKAMLRFDVYNIDVCEA